MGRTLSKTDLDSVEGLSGREAAKVLGVGKSTVNDARAMRRMRELIDTPPATAEDGYSETWQGPDGVISITANERITEQDVLKKFGHNPEDVEIVGTLGESHWMVGDTWKHSYRFKSRKRHSDVEFIADPVALYQSVRLRRQEPEKLGGDSAFVLSLNDTQFGKDEGGGTPATLARIESALVAAEARIKELRSIGRELGTFVLIGGGDIIEGCSVYPNQSYSLDLDRRGQINTAVATILGTLDRLAPHFEKVIVLAAMGNHGENRINGNRTKVHDNDDVLVFEMAKIATDRDPRMSHIEYIIANDEAGVWVDVCGWRLATTHGDIYAKGVGGATIDKKAQNWYKNMAMKRDPLGSADILIGHHYHHGKMSDWGSCLWRQTPAIDGGSKWFESTSGEYSLPGMLSFVIRPGVRYSDEQVLV